jgi:hypothetical protein
MERLKCALMPYHHPPVYVMHEEFKPKFGKLEMLSKEQLIEIIRKKTDFKEDNNLYFNNDFNVKYVKAESFISSNFIRNKCEKFKITNLYTVFNNNFQDLIDVNKEKIQDIINKNKINYINKFMINSYQLTKELIIYELYIVGKYA